MKGSREFVKVVVYALGESPHPAIQSLVTKKLESTFCYGENQGLYA